MAASKSKKNTKVDVNNEQPVKIVKKQKATDEKAKVLATVIAILLIPAVLIVWNYSNKKSVFEENELEKGLKLSMISDSSKEEEIPSEKSIYIVIPEENKTETVPVESSTYEVNQDESNVSTETETVTTDNNEVTTQTEEENNANEDKSISAKIKKLLAAIGIIKTVDKITQPEDTAMNQEEISEPSETSEASSETSGTSESTETAMETEETVAEEQPQQSVEESTSSDTEFKGDIEVPNNSGKQNLDDLVLIPNTSGNEYKVSEGDNIYSISMKVCGNNNYYLNNLNKDYLKVGSIIIVDCE